MLKGKTIIELTDVNTGEKEVIEENNMVTNALNDLFNTFPNLLNAYSIYRGGMFEGYGKNLDFIRLYEFLLGGILLFDSQIEEKPENTYAPASANLVGCGVYSHQNSTGNRKRGNYNQTESEFNEEQRYMKFVYDFSTSQANGTIASVCLTSYMGGCTSYGGKEAEKIKRASNGKLDYTYNFGIKPFPYNIYSYNDNSVSGNDFQRRYYLMDCCAPRAFSFDGNYKRAIEDKEYSVLVGAYVFNQSSTYTLNKIYYGEYLIFVDVDEDAVYYLKTKDFKKFWIVKRQAYLKSFSILDCPSFKGKLIEEYELPETADMYPYYNGRYYRFDTATKCLYIFYNTYNRGYSYVKPNEIIKTVKIDLSNMQNISLQEFDITNMTGKSLDFYKRKPFVNNGFLYMGDYENTSESSTEKPNYFKIEIANPANVSEILYDYTEASYDTNDYPVYEHNGIIYMRKGNIIKNNEILKTELNCFSNFSEDYIDSNNLVPFMINGKPSNFIFVYDGSPRPYNTPTKDNIILYTPINGIIYMNNYLATINNLAEPVTKTADKTMKITYIIQETEPEEVVH